MQAKHLQAGQKWTWKLTDFQPVLKPRFPLVVAKPECNWYLLVLIYSLYQKNRQSNISVLIQGDLARKVFLSFSCIPKQYHMVRTSRLGQFSREKVLMGQGNDAVGQLGVERISSAVGFGLSTNDAAVDSSGASRQKNVLQRLIQ
jgi:hypothetical protein